MLSLSLLALLAWGCAEPEREPLQDVTGGVDEIGAVNDSFWHALVSGDTLLLQDLLVEEWALAAGQSRRPKADFLALFRDGQLRYDSISHSDVSVTRYGNTGVVKGRVVAWYTFRQQPGQERLQYLAVFGKVGAQWRMLAYQSAVAAVQ
jgi:hypothetical protein